MDEALDLLSDAISLFECYCQEDGPEITWLIKANEFLQSWGEFLYNTASSPTAPSSPATGVRRVF